MAPRVFFYVQHLLGIGHVKRASLLVRQWLDAGLEVCVVSGGAPVAGFGFEGAELIQLPVLRAADEQFSALVDEDGRPVDEAFHEDRRRQLLDALMVFSPDVIVLENYPFGRRQLRGELLALLETAQHLPSRPAVLSSVRDILQQRRPQRITETLELLEAYFDGVLVHGDPDFIPLGESFPTDRLSVPLYYTGYVGDGAEPVVDESSEAVLVSAGGGAVGEKLMMAALKARPLTALADCRWRFLLGPNVQPQSRARLVAAAGEGIVIEPARTDFPELLRRCRLSISQAGYNTVMDLLSAGCSAVLVPFEGSGETEQRKRAEHLESTVGYPMVPESELSPASLAAAVDRAVACRPRSAGVARDRGQSAALLRELARRTPS